MLFGLILVHKLDTSSMVKDLHWFYLPITITKTEWL